MRHVNVGCCRGVTLCEQVSVKDADAVLEVELEPGPPTGLLRLDARTIKIQVRQSEASTSPVPLHCRPPRKGL